MKALEKLRDTLCEELEKVSQKTTMSAGDLEMAHKLTDTIKNIDKIFMMDETGEYSQAGDWEARGMYDNGNSYANRGEHWVRGHYSRARDGRTGRSGMRSYSRMYSRDGGHSDMIESLEDMREEATSEKERKAIDRCIEQLKDM